MKKKLIVALMSALMVMSITACGNTTTAEEKNTRDAVEVVEDDHGKPILDKIDDAKELEVTEDTKDDEMVSSEITEEDSDKEMEDEEANKQEFSKDDVSFDAHDETELGGN